MSSVDIRKLAALARLDVSDEEITKLTHEIPAILAFVETVQKVAGSAGVPDATQNVMRDDTHAHEPGKYTDDLLKAAPQVKNGKVVVKQVIFRNRS